MYGDQCGEFLDWHLGLKGYITDTKSSNLYFFRAFIIQSSFFCLTSIPSNKKHWKTEANPKLWRNGSKARIYVFSTDVVFLHYFHISKIFPVSVSKIQYNFHQNLKKQNKTKQKSMSENLKSIFLSVSKIYSSPTILILWDGELLLFFFLCSLSPEEREKFKRQMRREAAIRNAK